MPTVIFPSMFEDEGVGLDAAGGIAVEPVITVESVIIACAKVVADILVLVNRGGFGDTLAIADVDGAVMDMAELAGVPEAAEVGLADSWDDPYGTGAFEITNGPLLDGDLPTSGPRGFCGSNRKRNVESLSKTSLGRSAVQLYEELTVVFSCAVSSRSAYKTKAKIPTRRVRCGIV